MIAIYEPGIMFSTAQQTTVQWNGLTFAVLHSRSQLREVYRFGCLANLYSCRMASLVIAGVVLNACRPCYGAYQCVPGFPPF